MKNENPLNQYYAGKFEKQLQPYPRLQSKMNPCQILEKIRIKVQIN